MLVVVLVSETPVIREEGPKIETVAELELRRLATKVSLVLDVLPVLEREAAFGSAIPVPLDIELLLSLPTVEYSELVCATEVVSCAVLSEMKLVKDAALAEDDARLDDDSIVDDNERVGDNTRADEDARAEDEVMDVEDTKAVDETALLDKLELANELIRSLES